MVWFLRVGGVKVDFTSPMGIIAVIVGGLSSALWGSLASIIYHQSSFKQVLKDFFKSKTVLQIIVWCSFSCYSTFSLYLRVVRLPLNRWSCQWCLFQGPSFGGIEEIGWRYFFQPTLEERIPYLSATLITFLAWSSWHLFYFYIDGSLAVIQLLPFLVDC